jgi:putative DNA primase/helicase
MVEPTQEPAGGKRSPRGPLRPVEDGDTDWRSNLVYRQAGKRRVVEHVPANAISILRHDDAWTGVLAWDVFALELRTLKAPPWHIDDAPSRPWTAGDPWTDTDTVRVQAWLQRKWGIKLGLDAVWSAVRTAAEVQTIHPPRDYLDALVWDGVRRLPTFLPVYFGAEASAYTALVGPWFLIGAVARIYRPGCDLHTMLVLEGPQGRGKSTAVRELFGAQWFSDTPIDLENKDRFSAVRGLWGHEFAELDSFRKGDHTRAKSFISPASDRYRPPYGRVDIVVPRTCVFVGTTNTDEYLSDPTGNRRYWPVKCAAIDLDAIRRDRDQLWAEAREAFRSGAKWHPTFDEQAEHLSTEQEARVVADVWQDKVAHWLSSKLPGVAVTVGDALGHLGLEPGRWSQTDANRAARCLQRAGWARRQVRESEGRRRWVYLAPG